MSVDSVMFELVCVSLTRFRDGVDRQQWGGVFCQQGAWSGGGGRVRTPVAVRTDV